MSAQDQHTKFKHHKLTAEQEAKLRSVIGFSFSGSDGVSSSGKGKESMSETHPDMDVDDKSDGVSSMPVDRASGCKRQCSCSLGCSACVKTARVTPAKREARLKEAKELFEKGLIHLRDYDQKKAEILSSL